MEREKHIKVFIIMTILFKVFVNSSMPVFYEMSRGYGIAIGYTLFNFLIMYSIAKEPMRDVKHSVSFAIILDQLYSVIMNVVLAAPIKWIVYIYPSSTLLYFIGAETFINTKVLLSAVTIFSIIFLGHMIYRFRGDWSEMHVYITMMFAFQIVFMSYKIMIK